MLTSECDLERETAVVRPLGLELPIAQGLGLSTVGMSLVLNRISHEVHYLNGI